MNSMRIPVSKLIPVPNSTEVARSSSDLVADFLRVRISANTRRNYGKAISDFCRRTYEREVSERLMTQFLSLHQSEAVYQVLQYRQLLIEAKLQRFKGWWGTVIFTSPIQNWTGLPIGDKLRRECSRQEGLSRWLKEKWPFSTHSFWEGVNNQFLECFANRFNNSQIFIFRSGKIFNRIGS